MRQRGNAQTLCFALFFAFCFIAPCRATAGEVGIVSAEPPSFIDEYAREWWDARNDEERDAANRKLVQELERRRREEQPKRAPLPMQRVPVIDAPPAAGSPAYPLNLPYFIRYPGTADGIDLTAALLIAPVGIALSGQMADLIGVLALLYAVCRLGAALYRKDAGILPYVAGAYAYAVYVCILGAIMDGRVVNPPRYYLLLQNTPVPAGEPTNAAAVMIGFAFTAMFALGVKYAVARWRCQDDESAAKTCVFGGILVFAIPVFIRTLASLDIGGTRVLASKGGTGLFLLLAALGLLFDAVLLQRTQGYDKESSADLALWTNAAAATLTVTVAVLFKAFFV